MVQLAAVYTLKAHVAGHRADIYLIEAARAEAALAGRKYVLPKDLEKAAENSLDLAASDFKSALAAKQINAVRMDSKSGKSVLFTLPNTGKPNLEVCIL